MNNLNVCKKRTPHPTMIVRLVLILFSISWASAATQTFNTPVSITDPTDAVNLTTGSFTTLGGGSFAQNLYGGKFFVTTGASEWNGGHLFHVGTTNTNPRLAIYNNGTLLWGPGNTPGDTNLYRDAVGSLKTDTAFTCGGVIRAAGDANIGGDINLTTIAKRIAWSVSGAYYNWIECAGGAGTTYMRFSVGNSESVRIDAAGNVGIGTTVPTSKLTVNGSSLLGNPTANGIVRINAANASQAELQFYNQSTAGYALYKPANTTDVRFYHTTSGDVMALSAAGNVTIRGTVPPAPTGSIDGQVIMGGGRVMVGGTLSAKEIKVTTTGADYVFENNYKLRPLAEVESFIAEHKHLPDMMSAKEMQTEGMPVSEVVTKQLAKIEELTLYAIAADKRNQDLNKETAALREENQGLKERLAIIERALGLGEPIK